MQILSHKGCFSSMRKSNTFILNFYGNLHYLGTLFFNPWHDPQCYSKVAWLRVIQEYRNISSLSNQTKPLPCLTNCLKHRTPCLGMDWSSFEVCRSVWGQHFKPLLRLDWTGFLWLTHKKTAQAKTFSFSAGQIKKMCLKYCMYFLLSNNKCVVVSKTAGTHWDLLKYSMS